MTLVDKHGEPISQDELAADLAKDLREYTSLSREEIDERVRRFYPGVMRRLEAERAARDQHDTGDDA